MKTAYQHFRSLVVQTSIAGAAFMNAASVMAQAPAPAPKQVPQTAPAKSAACANAQKIVNKDGLNQYTLQDLTAHPTLAGATVTISLRGKDAVNPSVRSEKCQVTIPHQTFYHPVAIIMVELRRNLAKDSNQSGAIAQRLEKLLQDKAGTIVNPETMAFLKNIQKNLSEAKETEVFENVLRDMWEAMQRLEQENISKAEQRLREMEQALREALQRGANEEQIRELTKESMKAMQDALKEQAAKSSQSEQAKKDMEDMQKRLEEMKKMLEELQNMDPKLAQKMQEMMKQMQELAKQQKQMEQQMQQQMQNSPEQQQQQSQQQQNMQQRMERMKQQMQKMQQQMQQQQQNQQMMKDMNDLIKDQEDLRNETAEEREKRKEDMKRILEQLEEYARELKKKIGEKTSEEYQKQYNPSSPYDTGEHSFLRYHKPVLVAAYGLDILQLAQAETKPAPFDREASEKKIKRLGELGTDVDTTAKDLKDRRENEKQLQESEAEGIIEKFQRIQREIEQLEKQQPPQNQQQGQKNPQQQQQQQQRDQEQQEMLKKIEEAIKRLREKQQQQQQQQQQNQQQQAGQKKPQNQQQRDLQKRLSEMMEKMKQRGMDPGKLQDADKSMDQAGEELDQGDPGDAVPKQDEALQQLREGQKQMQQQMQQQQKPGQQPGQGQGQGPGQGEGEGEGDSSPTDILGRRMDRSGQDLGSLDSENLSQQRRDEIMKRIQTNPAMPKAEREYLERLLNPQSSKRPFGKPSP